GAAVRAPATPVGDPADLLDVHVHQLAGTVAFIAHRGGLAGADHLAADRVELTQVGQSVAAQDPRHGPRTDAEFGPEPVRPTTFPLPQGHDLVGELAAGAGRATMRARGTLAKPLLALAAIPVDPARGALARDTHLLGHVRDRAPLPEYPIDNDAAAVQGQPGITVGHENLRSEWVLDSHTPTGGSPHINNPSQACPAHRPSPTSWPSTPRTSASAGDDDAGAHLVQATGQRGAQRGVGHHRVDALEVADADGAGSALLGGVADQHDVLRGVQQRLLDAELELGADVDATGVDAGRAEDEQ